MFCGDRAGQALAHPQLGDVDRLLAQAARGEQLEHAVAQQVDRADLAIHRLADDVDDLVELALRRAALGHDLVQTGQDLASGGGGGGGHRRGAIRCGVGLSRVAVVKSQMFRNWTAHSVMRALGRFAG